MLKLIHPCHPRAVEAGATTFLDKVEPHRPSLLRYALRLCGDRADADDLVQETMARALRRVDSVPDGDGAGPWLMVTLYRLFIDHCRRRKAESSAHDGIRHITSGKTGERPVNLPRWMTVTDEELRSAIGALPTSLRTPYTLRASGQSYQQIADALGLGINTVSTRIRRARLALKEALS